MDLKRVNEYSFPLLLVTIIAGCTIIGGFYYAVEARKQASIERERAAEVAEKERQVAAANRAAEQARMQREMCHHEAVSSSMATQKRICASVDYPPNMRQALCGEGMYSRDVYERDYENCLRKHGLD